MDTKTTSKGFTLMEMMLVIFIIGVLSTVVITGLSSSRMKARDDERVADLAQLQLALEMYYNACARQYPQPNGSKALVTTASNGCSPGTTFGTFMKKIPKDPKDSTTNYYYQVNANPATSYVLRAQMETSHRTLLTDIDGPVFPTLTPSVGCDDASPYFYYCVQP
jgi:type II secretion system protein G